MFRMHLAGAACAVSLALAGCEMAPSEPPRCNPAMPAQAEFLRDPAFAPLTYHKRVEFDARRGNAYDLWADSKFEYSTGLQFSLVSRGTTSQDRLCVQSVALKFALPPDRKQRERLRAFVLKAAASTKADAKRLEARLEELIARGEKYQSILKDASITVEAGAVTHAVRGDFFVVTFAWPSR